MGKSSLKSHYLSEQRPEVRQRATWLHEGRLFRDEETELAHCEAGVCLAFGRNNEVVITPGLCEGESSKRDVREL